MPTIEGSDPKARSKTGLNAKIVYSFYLLAASFWIIGLVVQVVMIQSSGPFIFNPDAAALGVFGVCLVLGVLLPIAGVITAYAAGRSEVSLFNIHRRFQIRTFWMGMLYNVLSGLATFVPVAGEISRLIVFVWWVGRCVKGLRHLSRQQGYFNERTWGWQ